MLGFEYKYVHDSLDQLRDAVEKSKEDIVSVEGSSTDKYIEGVYHGLLSAYSSMVYYWTKIIIGEGGE